MDTLIVFGATYLIYVVALGAVGVMLVSPHRQRLALIALVALALAYALARVAGALYSHPQPFVVDGTTPLIPHAIDNAFPSDHTLVGGVFASVAFLADKRVGMVLWALTLLVGTARMAAGLHTWVDIVAAALIAGVVVWLGTYTARLLHAPLQHI